MHWRENAAIPAADKAINHAIYHYDQPYDYEGVMQGSPPPPDQVVTRANFTSHHKLWRWAMQHVRELCSTQMLSRGTGPIIPLPVDARNINELPGVGWLRLRQWPNSSNTSIQTDTDGFIVASRGTCSYRTILVWK